MGASMGRSGLGSTRACLVRVSYRCRRGWHREKVVRFEGVPDARAWGAGECERLLSQSFSVLGWMVVDLATRDVLLSVYFNDSSVDPPRPLPRWAQQAP